MLELENELLPGEQMPHSTDAEQGVLCGLLHYPELMGEVVGKLQPEHFYRTAHQAIFAAMLDCFERQLTIEPIALSESLRAFNTLAMAGGSSYLYDLMIGDNPNATVLNTSSLLYWARVIVDMAKRRELIRACEDMRAAAADCSQSNYLEVGENLLFYLAQAYPTDSEKPVSHLDAALAMLEQEANAPNGVTGLSTGFHSLDAVTHGFQPWQLITVAARSGGGKSAFALSVVSHIIQHERRPVLYISLEMDGKEHFKRLIKAMAGTSYQMDKLKQAHENLKAFEKNLLMEDASGQTLATIQSKILKTKKARPDLALVVIDHIGLIQPESKGGKFQNRAYEIQEITSRLKALAKTLQVPILQLAQMNRAIEGRQDKTPMLSDLRDSGSIEMDSDLVLFVTIEREGGKTTGTPTGNATLSIAKQRDGLQMEIPLLFIAHLTRFKEKVSYLN